MSEQVQSVSQPVAVVTGASSGIGKETAKALVGQGWHVIAHGRNAERSKAAEAEIRSAISQGGHLSMVMADLSLMADTARMADAISALTDRIDVLVNNAGGVRDARVVTTEGNEVTFAGNHLGHFLLTRRLLPLLLARAGERADGKARVLNVSSRAHLVCQSIDWDDLQGIANWASVPAYGLVKLANILFTRELARRHGAQGIVSHALHPGTVASNFASHGNADMQRHMAAADSISPATAAAPLVWLATAAEPATCNALYWAGTSPEEPSALAQDDAAALRLWQESEALLGGLLPQ